MNTGIPISFYELLRVTVISGEVLLSPENIFRVECRCNGGKNVSYVKYQKINFPELF